jgi:hypothetical protein
MAAPSASKRKVADVGEYVTCVREYGLPQIRCAGRRDLPAPADRSRPLAVVLEGGDTKRCVNGTWGAGMGRLCLSLVDGRIVRAGGVSMVYRSLS